MFWLWRYVAFILWSGLCRAYRVRIRPGALLSHLPGWGWRPVDRRAELPAGHMVPLAARRAADWRSIDALLESLRDGTAGEDQAA
jgi:hypothetical protein